MVTSNSIDDTFDEAVKKRKYECSGEIKVCKKTRKNNDDDFTEKKNDSNSIDTSVNDVQRLNLPQNCTCPSSQIFEGLQG